MPDDVAMWAAAGLAVVFALWRFWRLVAARVHVAVATVTVARLVRAGNLDRARKLCAAAPRAVYLMSVREALAEPADARSRFADAFARAMAPLEANRWMDLTALAAALLAVIVAATADKPSLPVLVLAPFAALGALINVQTMRRLRRDPPLAFATIAEALAEREATRPPAAPEPPAPATADPFEQPAPAPVARTAPTASSRDLRSGSCPLCGGSDIAERPAIGGDLVPWVCQGCGHAQLFARR